MFRNSLQNFLKFTQVQKGFSTGTWSHLKPRPADPILGIVEEFKKDKDSRKVNLSAGTYKDNEGKPYILNCVRAAEKIIMEKNFDHEYLPIDGLASFNANSLKLAYTEENKALKEGRILGVQTLSGTGALKVGFEFFADHFPGNKTVYIPNPSWPNHKNVAQRSGLECKEYRYYDFKNKSLNLQGMLEDLDKAPENSIVVLHVCAHNPTGMDPNESQWDDIYKLISKKNHFPFFDMAYQGFASGDLTKDAHGLRRFAREGGRLALAQSYAKNFGLYGQRVGCFSLVTESKEVANTALSHVKFIARAQYSNPPKYGAHIVDIVLSDRELTKEWHRELKVMSDRISSMRQGIYNGLKAAGSKQSWEHIIQQIGMFAYTGLTLDQVKRLKSEFHIYLTDDGRISISGLNTSNVDYVAKAFHEVTK